MHPAIFTQTYIKKVNFLLLLSLSIFCIGRIWQHLIGAVPYREVLWHEPWMQSIVGSMHGISWEEFVHSRSAEHLAQFVKWIGACIYLTIFIWLLTFKNKSLQLFDKVVLVIWFCWGCFYGFCIVKGSFYTIGSILESALQVIFPVLVYFWRLDRYDHLVHWLKYGICFLFIGHGLYAMNYFPVPGDFVTMTTNILKVSEPAARMFLQIIGIIDILVALIILFIKKPLLIKWSIFYLIFWSTATAFARLIGHWYPDFVQEVVKQWTPEVLVRFPHFLLATVLYFSIHILSGTHNVRTAHDF